MTINDKTKIMFYVYEHVFPNNKKYIGITSQRPEDRWDYGWGYREDIQPVISRAIKKYGWNNIKHNILFSGLSLEEAQNKEKELIIQFHTCVLDPLCQGYNMTYGGEGSLKYLTEEERQQATQNNIKKSRETHRERHNLSQQKYYQRNREKLLQKQQQKRSQQHKNHIPQTREEKLMKKREAERKRKNNMTPEQREQFLQKKREYYIKNKEKISYQRKEKYNNLTLEQKEQLNKQKRLYNETHKEELRQYYHKRWLQKKLNKLEAKGE